MNEETVLETEIQTVPTAEPTATICEEVPTETASSFLDLQDRPETTELTTIEVIQSVGSDVVHADLFGSFLICGTLVGIFLLRGRYGT